MTKTVKSIVKPTIKKVSKSTVKKIVRPTIKKVSKSTVKKIVRPTIKKVSKSTVQITPNLKFDKELFYFNTNSTPKKYIKSIPDFVKNGVITKGTTFGVTFSKRNCKGGFAMQKGAFKRSLTSQLKSRGLRILNTYCDDIKKSSVESLFFKIDSIQ